MVVKKYLDLFKNQSSASSVVIQNTNCDTMSLSISGSFSSITLKIQGTNTFDSTNYFDVAAIKMSDLSVCQQITATGLYTVSIEGMANIKVEITAISGGDATVKARLVSAI